VTDDALRRYLIDLATSPAALGAFRRDPTGTAKRRLPEADAAVLLGGDPAALHARLGGAEDLGAPPSGNGAAHIAAADLTIVGSGIRALGQFTVEALAAVTVADKVWHLIADEIGTAVVQALNPSAETLLGLYAEGKLRLRTYEEMTERILQTVRAGARTCAVFYGHPGVFVYPSHLAVAAARREGYTAELLPAVSAEDSLYADLGIDPGTTGVQAYEATDFLMHERIPELSAGLLLWQVGVVGEWDHSTAGVDRSALRMLVRKLCRFYPSVHETVLYEASVYPGTAPRTTPVPLKCVGEAAVSPATTMYIPARQAPAVDPDWWTNRHQLTRTPPVA
jgi:siroheme synthase